MLSSYAQKCDSTLITIRKIRASDTDANISWELATHYTFYNANCSPKNTLLVYLVGSYDNPLNTLKFTSLAANHGYHVVSLKYPNSVAAKSACANSTNPDCYLNFRKEIIEGIDYSSKVTVNNTDCINNRLIKLLQHLDNAHPGENWGQFFSNNDVNWTSVVTAGHSQGGGHAAFLGVNNNLKRVIMFASPNDFSSNFNSPANWCSGPFTTRDSVFFGFNNLQDDVVNFNEQKKIWDALPFPSLDDTTRVDDILSPFGNSHKLYTNYHGGTESSQNHNAVVRDSHTPLKPDGRPVYEDVWKYLLGINEGTSSIQNLMKTKPSLTPNPVINSFSIKNIDISRVDVYDLNGQKLLSKTSLLGEEIWVPDLHPGMYNAVITDINDQSVQIKFIKL